MGYLPLGPSERGILERLLSADFAGAAILREQALMVEAEAVKARGMLAWSLRAEASSPADAVKYAIPVEGSAVLAGGVDVQVRLQVEKGRLARLEIFRLDGEALDQLPTPEAITVSVPGPLDAWSSGTLRHLLFSEFPGVTELRAQATSVESRWVDTGAGVMVYLYVEVTSHPAAVVFRVPVEGRGIDRDGVEIEVLLHVLGGRLYMIEMYRVDELPLDRVPSPESLRIEICG